MPFIPHTHADIENMLGTIGAPNIDALFGEIPPELRAKGLTQVPHSLREMEVTQLMLERAKQDGMLLNFCGAGAYEHHIPAAVWQITTRGEFYSAYTPYQAEASQGTLQVLYEFQTMMTELTGMDISNASMYDGATALAEALLMASRSNSSNDGDVMLVPKNLHPYYAEVVHACTHAQGIRQEFVGYDAKTGQTDLAALKAHTGSKPTAVVIAQPNFFGVLEEVDAITDWAHEQGAMVVACVNPTTLALLKPPSEWGAKGADIVCGEGQPLGSPLSSGGPYFGFLTCRQQFVRQMPGRIVGRTLDMDGKPGFTLTLQAREQHIRRAKATSNICTNQGLLVTAATIYMSIIGPEGLAKIGTASVAHTASLVEQLTQIAGVRKVFTGHHFHETAITLTKPVAPVLEALANDGIFGGFDLSQHFPELGNALLVCATETKTALQLASYAKALAKVLAS